MTDTTDAALDALVKRLNDKCEREFSYDRDADEAADAITALRARLADAYARGVHAALHEFDTGTEWMEIRDAIRALASAPPAPVVGVKPLVWIRHPTAEVWRCDTLIGTYKIFAVKHPVSWDFDGLDNEGISLSTSKMAQSHEAAKAAAQSDYEARILAALLPQAEGRDA